MSRIRLLRHSFFTCFALACSLDERQLRPVSGTGAVGSGNSGSGAAASGGAGDGAETPNGGDAPSSFGGSGETPVAAACGNGIVEGDEACDDGGESDHDGCDTACAVEPDYHCSGSPSSCSTCTGEAGERRCFVAGGPFERGEPEERVSASVAPFWLDELEITVGRFRPFVASFQGAPAGGAGAHPSVPESGWRDEWSAQLATTSEGLAASLLCNHDWQTWSDSPGEQEELPLACASYYVAFAFCTAQGGRLPTEAEWEYVAAGGSQQRTYPWGDAPPNAELAQFGSLSPALTGTHSPGMARFGQQDLAGSIWEWTLDYFAPYPASCERCAEVENGFDRVLRGGDWLGDAAFLTAAYRFKADPAAALANVGFRCAYDP